MAAEETWNQSFGRMGEALAKIHLRKLGYRILEERFRTPFGEIDLIAMKDGILSFIEVKSRRSADFGHPWEAITPLKLKHWENAAHYFLLRKGRTTETCPHIFEAISVLGSGPDAEVEKVTLEL